MASRSNNNPGKLTPEEQRQLLQDIFQNPSFDLKLKKIKDALSEGKSVRYSYFTKEEALKMFKGESLEQFKKIVEELNKKGEVIELKVPKN